MSILRPSFSLPREGGRKEEWEGSGGGLPARKHGGIQGGARRERGQCAPVESYRRWFGATVSRLTVNGKGFGVGLCFARVRNAFESRGLGSQVTLVPQTQNRFLKQRRLTILSIYSIHGDKGL